MRLSIRFFIIMLTVAIAAHWFTTHAGASDSESQTRWVPYPEDLPKFDFHGDKLKENWDSLTAGYRDAFPDADEMRRLAKKYPKLYEATVDHILNSKNTDPSFEQMANVERELAYDLYAKKMQEVWMLTFEGRFQEAKELGMKLGPAGYFPGLYSQICYANHLAPDEKTKEALYYEVMFYTKKYRPLAPDYSFLRVGDAYAKARILENLSPEKGLQTGYAGDLLKDLEDLLKENPKNLYATSLIGGVHAGIIEKAGKFLARVYYGSTPEMMENYFSKAVALYRGYPVINDEYAMALRRVYEEDELPKAISLLEEAEKFQPRCAEEALEVMKAKKLLREYRKEL